MIFWTVVFITYYLMVLVRGNIFYDILQKAGELTIKQATMTTKKEKDAIGSEIMKVAWKILLAIPLLIAECIYLFKAISIDTLKYPTLIILFYSLLTTFVLNKSKKTKEDLTTEEGRIRYKITLEKIKRYSFKSFITTLIFLGYFGYMFYLLVLR